jgi:hypothetical protein
MSRIPKLLLCAVAIAGVLSCARAARINEVERKCNDRVAALEERVKSMEDFLAKATGGQYPPEKEPDPAATYSVPIEGDPIRGPATAKVTIVEAAEFT